MILMRNGGTKQRKDAIAEGLCHVALIAMHRLHHQRQGRVDDLARLLGVEVFEQVHGALDVGKQGGDGLALAVGGPARLQGRLLGQDALGQVARRVGDGTGLAPSRRLRGWRPASRAGRADGWRCTGPDQDVAPLIHGQALALDEFGFQIVQVGVIELELPLEGAIGQAPPALEHGYRLVEDLLKGHRPPSLCR